MSQDEREENAARVLERLGDDVRKWAEAFQKQATKLGHSRMDGPRLIGWFANAIGHSSYTVMANAPDDMIVLLREGGDGA